MTTLALPQEHAAAVEHAEALRLLPTGVPRIFIVPAYNEEDNLPRLLADLEARLDLLEPYGSRVIIVDDGSSDATASIALAYTGPVPLELVRLPTNQGPGAAFRTGFAHALAAVPAEALVITLEADTTCDLDVLPDMLRCAAEGNDVVLASVHGGGRMVNVSPLRQVLSRGAGFVVRHALGIDARTVSSFFRVYRASILRAGVRRYGDDLIREEGFACKAEILAKLAALEARVIEVPVDLDATRRIGESKMSIRSTLAGYARLIARGRPSRAPAP